MDENERPVGTVGEVVTPNETETKPNAEEGGNETGAAAPSEQEEREREERRRMKAARQSGEREGYERAQRDFEKRLAGYGLRDPNTQERITTEEGLRGFARSARQASAAARAKQQNRSVEEILREEEDRDLADQARKDRAEREREADDERKRREWIAADALDFAEKHPEVDLRALDGNQAFRRFCGSRYGREPLSELYEDYMELAGEAQKTASARREGKAERSTGAGGGAGSDTLTAAQQRDLDEWNRSYPDMKMTAKEFLAK